MKMKKPSRQNSVENDRECYYGEPLALAHQKINAMRVIKRNGLTNTIIKLTIHGLFHAWHKK